MLILDRLQPYEQISVKYLSKFMHFHWKNNDWNIRLIFIPKVRAHLRVNEYMGNEQFIALSLPNVCVFARTRTHVKDFAVIQTIRCMHTCIIVQINSRNPWYKPFYIDIWRERTFNDVTEHPPCSTRTLHVHVSRNVLRTLHCYRCVTFTPDLWEGGARL